MIPRRSLDKSKQVNLIMRKGDTFTWRIAVVDEAGAAFDFTGYAATCSVYSGPGDLIPNHSFVVELTSGQIAVTMTAANTSKIRRDSWLYFLKVTLPSAAIETWLNGTILVNEGTFNGIVNTEDAIVINSQDTEVTLDISSGEGGGEGGAVDWTDVENKPSTFPPSVHSHAYADITGKPTEFTPSAHTHDDRYYTETEVDGIVTQLQEESFLNALIFG